MKDSTTHLIVAEDQSRGFLYCTEADGEPLVFLSHESAINYLAKKDNQDALFEDNFLAKKTNIYIVEEVRKFTKVNFPTES